MPFLGLSSFRMRLMIGVLIPVFLIQSAGVVLDLVQLNNRYHAALETEAALVTDLVGDSLVQPLWDFEIAQVENMISALLNEDIVGKVQIIAPDTSVIAEKQADWFTPDNDDLQVSNVLRYDYDGQEEVLGELFVTLNTDSVKATLLQLVLQKLLISTTILALIAAALFLVLSRLARPLVAMSQTIEKIGTGELGDQIPGAGRNDEIGMVARALEQWQTNEAEVIQFRAQNDEFARRERRRIRRALESTHDAVLLADPTGRVVFCNPNAAQFFSGATVGKWLEFDQWLSLDAAKEIDGAIRDRANFQLETLVSRHLKDSKLNLLIRGGPIQDEDGGFLGTVILATDHTEQALQAKRAKYLSEHDSLTGLPNRRLMEETLQKWVLEDRQETSILLADLDQFKQINDTLGHPVGDALLQHVAQAFEACLGKHLLAARLGGDEFAILAKGKHGANKLKEIAQHLIERLALPQQIDGRILHTGLSIGIATVKASERSASDGIRRADLALYEAKKKGRGRLEVFHSELEAVVKRKSLLDAEIRKALKNNEISPVYQMQTDLKTRHIVGFETLARWSHPELGIISPEEFIPIAEEAGLIEELTYQIMIEACKTAVEWHEDGFAGRIAVNLSPKLFGAQIAEFVSDCLLVTNCPGTAIEAEITETVVLANGTSARTEIEALQKLGVTIALDDFGMGYSSLSYLQKFPVDKIKVDRAFVSIMPESAETRAIVTAITDLGHALGMQVTGEGAETEEHRDCLRRCNVDFLQGYIDGPPMKKDDATAVMRESLLNQRAS